jgi:hypothetical protein
MPHGVGENRPKRLVFTLHVVDARLSVRRLRYREAIRVHLGARRRERKHGQSPRRR